MTTVTFLFFAVVIFMVYDVWRKQDAVRARERLADDVEDFLESDAPQYLKDNAYILFRIALLREMAIYVLFAVLFNKKEAKPNNDNSSLMIATSPESKEKFAKLVMNSLLIMLKRAPITFFICGLLILLTVIVRVVVNRIAYNHLDPYKTIEDSLERISSKKYV